MKKLIDLGPPKTGPSPKAAIDIFAGQWAYQLPIPNTVSGTMRTFHIPPRVLDMMKEAFPDYKTFKVLELGPHEGEHSFHLSRSGVRAIYAIEGRPANFLKCLIVKNELKLHNVKFAVGDFVDYLETTDKVWDLIYCTGVLYHMKNPARVVELMARRARRLALSTVVFDLESMKRADESTAKDQFPTFWLKAVESIGYPHQAESGTYTYYRRKFVDSTFHTVMGHGNSHQLEANLVEAETLRDILVRCGGDLRYWSAAGGPRGPMAYAAVAFNKPS